MIRLSFTIICALMVIFEIIICVVLLKRRPEKLPLRLFMHILIGSMVTTVSYCVSIYVTNYFVMSLCNSIYFCSIDFLLLMLLDLIIQMTKFKMHLFQVVTRWMARIYAIFDCVVLLVNPFKEIALTYVKDPEVEGHWIYNSGVLYQLHLILCYIVIVMVIYCLVLKIVQTPPLFRSRYTLILLGILVIVILNALFLFVSTSINFRYDISVILYSVMAMIVYYNAVYYSKNKLLKTAPARVLDDLSHPIILFDYEKDFVIANNAADELFGNKFKLSTMDEFIKRLDIKDKIEEETENTSFQIVIDDQIYRCDFQTLHQKKSLQGYVFVFMEVSAEWDVLTGFHYAAAAMRDYSTAEVIYPIGVLMCDINHLAHINETYGHEAGDRAIVTVANILKAECPNGAYFVRMQDAILAAACPNTTLSDIKQIMGRVNEKTKSVQVEQEGLQVTCAFAMCTYSQPDVRKAFLSALEAIRVRKMLNPDSAHSSLLFSLARVLQESDPGTEEHVMRTRIMGEKLSERLGLSDEDDARLSLLCLLHDIGKLCIPLEILNKPGKLTVPEWELLKSHARKGWQIAKASSELSPLADLILCHHERWDGKGYPNGLAKEEIPLLSRIISIIDSYDAMTNDRPYKKKIDKYSAVLELERCSGNQFDPYITSVFCEMLRKESDYLRDAFSPEKLNSDFGGDDNRETSENYLTPVNGIDRAASMKFSRYILDSDAKVVVSTDEHFQYLTGSTPEDVAAGNVTQELLIFPEDRKEYNKLKNKLLLRDKEAFIEHRLRMKDGAYRYVCCHEWPYYDAASKELKNQVIITDITESFSARRLVGEERAIAQDNQRILMENLRKDGLTGVLNRTAFCNDFQEAITSDSKTCVMFMCDIDYFKEYNDSKGHIEGDELLKGFGQILLSHTKNEGLACRMGGDEFAIALFFAKDTPLEIIQQEGRNLWSSLESELTQFGDNVTISMGMAYSNGKEKNFDQIYFEADMALYQAKENGRHQIAF